MRAERRPIVEKIVAAATKSARWYEDFAAHMKLTPSEIWLQLYDPFRPGR